MTAALVGALVAGIVLSPCVGSLRSEAVRRRSRPARSPLRPARGAPSVGSRRAGCVAVGRLRELGGLARRVVRRPPDRTADLVVGVALVVAPLGTAIVGPLGAAGLVGVLLAAQVWFRRRCDQARHAAVRAVLPDVVDLFRLAVGAGSSVHQAIDVVAPRAAPPLGPALDEVRRRVMLGVRLGDALEGLDGLGDEARPLMAALAGAARYGSPLGAALDRVAVDARLLRRRCAEERARKLPVQLLFPLVMCVLPAFGLLAVVPLLAGSLPTLGAS